MKMTLDGSLHDSDVAGLMADKAEIEEIKDLFKLMDHYYKTVSILLEQITDYQYSAKDLDIIADQAFDGNTPTYIQELIDSTEDDQ